jgi:HK97 gp10 family phage protein
MPSSKVRVVVTGVRAIDRKLRALPFVMQGKVVRPAMRKGLRVVEKAVRVEAPVLSGATKAAVKVRAARKRKRGVIELEVRILAEGPLKKTSGRTGKTVFYPAIVEYGRRKQGVPPDDFMNRAYLKSGDAARKVTLRELKSGLDRAIRGA